MPTKRRAKRPASSASDQDAISSTTDLEPILPPAPSGKRKKSYASSTEYPSTVALMARPVYSDRIWVIDDFLSASECRAWVDYATTKGFSEVGHAATAEYAFRSNGRLELNCDATANGL